MVLVDTSVWIEFFKKNSKHSLEFLDYLLLDQRVAKCMMVFTEVLSAQMTESVLAEI